MLALQTLSTGFPLVRERKEATSFDVITGHAQTMHAFLSCFGLFLGRTLAFAIGTGKIRVVIIDSQVSRLGMFGLATDKGRHWKAFGNEWCSS